MKPRFTDAYTFYVNSDDGAKLWLTVNGQQTQILDSWYGDGLKERTSSQVSLTAGTWYAIKLEYFNQEVGAQVHLSCSSSLQVSAKIKSIT